MTGIYGGSFDPIHLGHLSVASYALENAGLDEVWLMVTPLNPLKSVSPPMFSDQDRLKMAALAVDSLRHVRVSDFEMNLPRPSFSYHTLKMLANEYPNRKFCLITGADNLRDFQKWRNPGEILREFGLIVYPRPGVKITPDYIQSLEKEYKTSGSILYLGAAPQLDISSTQLRTFLNAGTYESLSPFMPSRVIEFLQKSEGKVG